MSTPLDGIKVLDLSRVLAGPWCSMTLADLGAEVWKVEAPKGGDETRKWAPPSVGGISTYYLAVNRNKKALAIDMATSRGAELLRGLVRRADVVLENFLAKSLKRLGLDYESLKAIRPDIIHCSISGYGRDGPLADQPGYDFVIQAEAGLMAITGTKDGEPTRFGVAITDLVAGMNATQAILAALYHRQKTGEGQSIDISLYRGGIQLLANIASGYLNTGKEPERFGNAHPSIVPYQSFATADGLLALAVGTDEQFRRLCLAVLGRPDLAAAPEFATNRKRAENRAALVADLAAIFREQPTQAWLDRLGRGRGSRRQGAQGLGGLHRPARARRPDGGRSPSSRARPGQGRPLAPALFREQSRRTQSSAAPGRAYGRGSAASPGPGAGRDRGAAPGRRAVRRGAGEGGVALRRIGESRSWRNK